MRAKYDPEARAVYVYFDHPDAGRKASVKKTLVDLWPGVNVDIGHDNKPLGIEFLGVNEYTEEELGTTRIRQFSNYLYRLFLWDGCFFRSLLNKNMIVRRSTRMKRY